MEKQGQLYILTHGIFPQIQQQLQSLPVGVEEHSQAVKNEDFKARHGGTHLQAPQWAG